MVVVWRVALPETPKSDLRVPTRDGATAPVTHVCAPLSSLMGHVRARALRTNLSILTETP